MPLLEAIIQDEKFRGALAMRADFAADKEFLTTHGLRWQSTIVVFKGARKVGHSVGDLKQARIKKLLESAL